MPEPDALAARPDYRRPGPIERLFNAVFGLLAGYGIGLAHNYRLVVTGRRSGARRALPVNLFTHDGVHYLVAPRGDTEWVRNVRASGRLTLERGRQRFDCAAEELPPAARAPILAGYLRRFATTVQRYFSVTPDATPAEFAAIAARHPVFRLDGIR